MTTTLLIHYLNAGATQFPWPYLAASGVLSPFLAGIKHWLEIESTKKYKFLFIKFSGEQVMILLLGLLSTLAAIANYLLHVPSHNPKVIAVQASIVAFMTQPIYFFVVKPAVASFKRQLDKADQFNLEVKSAAVPAGTLVTPKQTEIKDFSAL